MGPFCVVKTRKQGKKVFIGIGGTLSGPCQKSKESSEIGTTTPADPQYTIDPARHQTAPSEIRTTTRADPVGRCIYCGLTEGLSDEHVIPLALGSRLVLPKASCRACAAVTSAFERHVLRGFMLDARTAGGFSTRRPKKRPTTSSFEIKRGDRFESIELPATESPGFLQLPILKLAAFLTGRPPVKGVEIIGIETIGFGKKPEEVASTAGTDTLRTTVNLDATAFVRLLAKIGYSYAVAVQGPYPRSEVPVLPLILGSADDGGTWVGSAEYRLSVEGKRPTHGLGLVSLTATVGEIAENVLVARIKLFANAGATGYEVVVRRRRVSVP